MGIEVWNYLKYRVKQYYYMKFLWAMLLGFLASFLINKFLWQESLGEIHSVLELICVVFNMSLFFIVWNKYEISPISSRIIAFGILSTSILDVIHIYYFQPLKFSPIADTNLGARFWVIGRLMEIITIFIASFNFEDKKIKINKNLICIVFISFPLVISYLSVTHNDFFPVMYNVEGLTSSKILIELIIIILVILSLLRHKNRISERGHISYEYLALALLGMIPTEICFMIYKTYASSIMVYGHVFRVIYCYFLHKSIFQGSINYTYEELKAQQQKNIHQEKLALLGQMGATIVHETRNFLTTIKGCSQLIETVSSEKKVIEYARKINANTDEVNRIISDFLSLSKPKNPIMEEIAVRDLLASIEATVKASSLIKDIEVDFINSIDDRYISCDETQLKKVVLNLCKNAVEAMSNLPSPKLTIEVGIEGHSNVYIKISDNGRGMSKETLTKIGTPFFTTKQSGTGLGLSVCYDIVEQHGGRIQVSSEVGHGTEFIIYLPGVEEEEEEAYINKIEEVQ